MTNNSLIVVFSESFLCAKMAPKATRHDSASPENDVPRESRINISHKHPRREEQTVKISRDLFTFVFGPWLVAKCAKSQ